MKERMRERRYDFDMAYEHLRSLIGEPEKSDTYFRWSFDVGSIYLTRKDINVIYDNRGRNQAQISLNKITNFSIDSSKLLFIWIGDDFIVFEAR